MDRGGLLTPRPRTNSKCIKELNVRPEPQSPRRKRGQQALGRGSGKCFRGTAPRAREPKGKTSRWASAGLRSVCTAKGPPAQRGTTEGTGEGLASDTADTRLIFKGHEGHLTPCQPLPPSNRSVRNGQGTEETFLQRVSGWRADPCVDHRCHGEVPVAERRGPHRHTLTQRVGHSCVAMPVRAQQHGPVPCAARRWRWTAGSPARVMPRS